MCFKEWFVKNSVCDVHMQDFENSVLHALETWTAFLHQATTLDFLVCLTLLYT